MWSVFRRQFIIFFPRGLGVVTTLENASFNAVLLVDEAALQFPARMSASEKNQRLLEIISLARQRNQTLIFISQEASYIYINILRGLNILIIKEPALLQALCERAEIKQFVQGAQREFEKIEDDKRSWSYIAFSPYGDQGMVKTAKPDFFTDELSKCYVLLSQDTKEKETKTLSKEEKKEKAYEWHIKDHLSVREIARRLGVSKSTAWNWIQEKEKEISESVNIMIGQIEEKISKIPIK